MKAILHISTKDKWEGGAHTPHYNLLCGRIGIIDYVDHFYTTFEEYGVTGVHELETLCEECKNHPDFILWTLANV